MDMDQRTEKQNKTILQKNVPRDLLTKSDSFEQMDFRMSNKFKNSLFLSVYWLNNSQTADNNVTTSAVQEQ